MAATLRVSADELRQQARRRGMLKGRQPEAEATREVLRWIGAQPPGGYRRDLLIEYLHRIQDEAGALRDRHLVIAERDGATVVYHLAEPRVIDVLDTMRHILRDSLARQTGLLVGSLA